MPDGLKTASALQKWLAGDIDVEKLREMLSEASSDDESSRQVKYFLDSRLLNRWNAAAQCSASRKREVADRTMLFLASDAEYRWPKVRSKILDRTRAASKVVMLVGVALVILGLPVGAVVGLILWSLLGADWLPVVPGAGIAAGIVLSIVGLGAGAIAETLWRRQLEAIWDQPGDRATLDLNFAFYPFADSRQFQQAGFRRADILNSLASEIRQAALSEDNSNRIEEATREHERIRQQALTDAAGRNPRRCPNCGARDYRRARQSKSESDPLVAARECKRCGCVWRRAWSRGDACLAIVLGSLLLVMMAWLFVVAVISVMGGEKLLLVMGLFSVGGIWYAWASLLREGWRVLHGRGQLGEVFKPGEPIGQEDVEVD